jgi:hypothetical protein
VFRHPEAVHLHGAGGSCVEPRRPAHLLGGYTRKRRGAFGREAPDELGVAFKALNPRLDELVLHQILLDDDRGEAVEEGHIGARTELQVDIRQPRELGATRIDHDELGAGEHGLFDASAGDGVTGRGVGAGDEEQVCALYFGQAVRGGARSEGETYSGRTRRMADARATVDVNRAKSNPEPLLKEVVLLVGAAR